MKFHWDAGYRKRKCVKNHVDGVFLVASKAEKENSRRAGFNKIGRQGRRTIWDTGEEHRDGEGAKESWGPIGHSFPAPHLLFKWVSRWELFFHKFISVDYKHGCAFPNTRVNQILGSIFVWYLFSNPKGSLWRVDPYICVYQTQYMEIQIPKGDKAGHAHLRKAFIMY